MNIARIQATDFGSWADLDLELAPGVSLISGPNGSGKSTALLAIEFALFGVSSGAERLVRRGTDHATARVTVDTERGRIIAERSIRLGAKTSVGLKLWLVDPETGQEEPLTAATVGETQRVLEVYLGVSQALLRASSFAMQGQGASFCEAAPSERKARLSEALGLELWAPLHEAAKAEKRAADESAGIARAELERLDKAGERHAAAVAAENEAGAAFAEAQAEEAIAIANADDLAEQAEAAREARRQHAAAVDAHARAEADHQRAGIERDAADEALATAKAAAANAPSVQAAEAVSVQAAVEVEESERAYATAIAVAKRFADDLTEARRLNDSAERSYVRAEEDEEDLHVRLTTARSGECAECGQPLVSRAGEELVERLTAAYGEAQRTTAAASSELIARRDRLAQLQGETMHDVEAAEGSAVRDARMRAHAADKALAEAQMIKSLAGSIDTAQQRARDAFDRQNETAATLREASAAVTAAYEILGATDPGVVEARYQAAQQELATARAAHSAAATELARAEEAAKLAERQATEETSARDALSVAEQSAAVAGILAAGFGPQGVPAMIVDGVLGDLADEANRVLAELASPIRVDLRSQKLLKTSDRLADTLDIIVTMDAMEAPYETLSGGERTRVALALRAALTRLLASKRGARVRMLVVDEPAGLDAAGAEHLAGVLNEFVTAGVFETILLVTHHDALADQIDRVVRIEKSPSGESRLAAASTAPAEPARIAS